MVSQERKLLGEGEKRMSEKLPKDPLHKKLQAQVGQGEVEGGVQW